MNKQFVWKSGARLKADAQSVGVALERLQKKHADALTPRIVVDAARPKGSQLHACFEWDDVRASELYREQQARHVLGSIRVVIVEDDSVDDEQIKRVYVNVEQRVGNDLERRYVPVARLSEDRALYRQVLAQAAKDIAAFRARYAEFASIADVAKAAERALLALSEEEQNATT